MHGDVAHLEPACALDERCAVDIVVEEETRSAIGRTELRVGLEGGDRIARDLRVHAVDFSRQRRHAAAVQQQPLGAVERVGSHKRRAGRLEVERIGVESSRHVRQHADRRVAVHEHVLQQRAAGEALDVIGLTAVALRRPFERVRPGRPAPRTLRVHVMQLHVEDELVAGDASLRGSLLERRLGRNRIESAALSRRREGPVERRQRRRRAEH